MDIHIHSPFSRATSRELMPADLYKWARIKGISLVWTGDFTHPEWLSILEEQLAPAEQGLFRLRNRQAPCVRPCPPGDEKKVRFLLTAEVSSIYKKNGRVRKVHNLILAPDMRTARKINSKLTSLGANLVSDGRPITGIDCRDLAEIVLSCSDRAMVIPSHIWTPWFSMLGSRSGFDSIKECFGDMSGHIHAVETGLSADPPMHWICSFLDNVTLISNSDAHSPGKLGRDATIMDTDLDYGAVTSAIESGEPSVLKGTVDLFPQEGKYHFDGHRKCQVRMSPAQTRQNRGVCPLCGKKVTIGVMNRVTQLSDRTEPVKKDRPGSQSVIPLKEIISEIEGVGVKTKTVARAYERIIESTGTELDILLNISVPEVRRTAGEAVAEAVKRMRSGRVLIQEGYDGSYGRIRLFNDKELQALGNGPALF